MRYLLPLMFALACPLMMILMMRGMHGGHGDDQQQHTHNGERPARIDPASEERIAELEREVAALREKTRDHDDASAAPR